mgnify:CR=1 FL=1
MVRLTELLPHIYVSIINNNMVDYDYIYFTSLDNIYHMDNSFPYLYDFSWGSHSCEWSVS